MKNFYLFLIALTFSAVSFGQTTLIDQQFNTTNQPANWTNSAITYTINGAVFGAAQGGPNPTRILNYSPNLIVGGYSSIDLAVDASRTGNESGLLNVQYSIDGGVNYLAGPTIAPGTNSSTVNVTININPPAASNMRIRFVKDAGNNSIRVSRIVATGTCTPSTQATNYSTTNINSPNSGNATLNWTRGNGDSVLVVLRENAPVNSNPTNGISYNANAAFGAGQEIGTGNFVVYNGSASTVNVTGLTPGNFYTVFIYEFNSAGNCYKTPALIGRIEVPSCQPATQASNYSTTDLNTPNSGDATLNWTRGSGDNVLVVMRQGSPVSADPTNGSTYTANAAFGTGDEIGAENYVVYRGTASSVNITGLNLGDTYHVAIYEFNSIGNCYNTSPVLRGQFLVPGITSYLFADGWIEPMGDPNGISTAVDNISILVGNAVINSNTLANNIDVNAFSSLTINPGVVLEVRGILKMESSNVRYSSLMADGTIVGSIRYERHVNGYPGVGVGVPNSTTSGANDLISSPLVSSQNFGEFAFSNPNIRFDTRLPENGGDPDLKLFGPFNKATGTYLTWNATTNASEDLVPGVGYRAASVDNSGFVFRGTVNQGIVTNNIIYSSGVAFAPWNLVGNPYPSYINVGDFLNYVVDPINGTRNIDLLEFLSGAIYGYDGNASDGYTIWNLNTPLKNIAPGQGFLMNADQSMVSMYDLTFAPSMRTIGTTDDFIPGRMANPNNLHIKLQANIGNMNSHTDFYFNDNSTSGLDRGYDAAVYGNVAPAKSIYSRLVDNSTSSDFGIQSLATETLGSDILVPLGIKASSGQQVTVSIAESDLPSNIEVYLEDHVNGTFTLLNNSDFVLTPSTALSGTGRFYLRFSNQTLSTPDTDINELQIFTSSSPRSLFVKGQLEETTNIAVYDVQGRKVLSTQLEASSNSNQVDVSNLSSGVYVVKLNNSSQEKTQKVILK